MRFFTRGFHNADLVKCFYGYWRIIIEQENTNADLIRQEVPKIERLKILREKAYRQLKLLKKSQDTIEALRKKSY